LYAKKRDKNSPGKGFLKKTIVDTKNNVILERENKNKGATSDYSVSNDSSGDDDGDDESRKTELLLKKYNIGQGGDSMKSRNGKTKNNRVNDEESPFGQKVLASIPMKLQRQIDNTLITATFASLLFVVLCGLGISYGAFKLVFPSVVLDPTIDSVIINILSPAFTPAFLVFLLCSVTLGVFKFAQISSDQTVYKE